MIENHVKAEAVAMTKMNQMLKEGRMLSCLIDQQTVILEMTRSAQANLKTPQRYFYLEMPRLITIELN